MKKEVSILITGDFCPVNGVSELVSNKDYAPLFNEFLLTIARSDLAITNLECPLTNAVNKIIKTGPLMKADIQSVEALSFAGIRLVTLANNHIMDYGIDGLRSTIEACKSYGIDYVGVGEDLNAARRVFETHIKGRNIAILNYAENEFSTTHGYKPGANPFDLINAYYDIISARKIADFVIVIIHGGNEQYNLPSPRLKKAFRYFADQGADIVLGHHSHCYSGYEIYNDVPLFYGLGNFIFHKPSKKDAPWNYGYAVEILINESLTFNLIPYSQCNDKMGIRPLDGRLRDEFFNTIQRLNTIIEDDDLLATSFKDYCRRMSRMYSSFLEPHSISFLHYLRNRRLFPSVISKKKRKLYLNLIRCESHRDVVLDLLSSDM
ncbi:MAG: CapA family protein [Bacteroidales bacterium]|nr:CapA family protein [Bacteroidales bacterium]